MEQRNDIQAFPQSVASTIGGGTVCSSDFHECDGMTLRDFFAAKTMPTVIASWARHDPGSWDSREMKEHMASIAYSFADAMLAAREK